ncbi:MAG: hypothetical protein QXU67_03165 [Candidatus Bathyarchaeia archaeon]
MIYAGLDVHKKSSVVTVTDSKGDEFIKQQKLPTNGEIVRLLKKFGALVEVAVEVTRGWYWLYDLL